jgi:hypothetical protein
MALVSMKMVWMVRTESCSVSFVSDSVASQTCWKAWTTSAAQILIP